MKQFREDMLEQFVITLGALGTAQKELRLLVEAPLGEKAIALDRVSLYMRERGTVLRSALSSARSAAELDESLRFDLLDVACRRGAAALRDEPVVGEQQASLVLRLLRSVPLMVQPPYLPIELPWLRRAPGPNEVDSHERAHPMPGGRGGLWVAVAEHAPADASSSALFGLFTDGSRVMCGLHTDPATGRAQPLDAVNTTGAKWLPLTEYMLPAFLVDLVAPIDPTGAPIVHVATEPALAAIARAEKMQIDAAFMAPIPMRTAITVRVEGESADLRRIVRERDHHAKRVGDLLHDSGWMLARTRALVKLVPEVRCVSCTWAGWLYSCAVHTEGLLLCPVCSFPCHDPRFGAPAWLLEWLFTEVAEESGKVARAEGTPAAAWRRVSRLEEAVAGFLGPQHPEGVMARRGAVVAALLGGDETRASEMVKRFLDDAALPAEVAEELRVLATGSALASFQPHQVSGVWPCCTQPLCVCGLGWLCWARRPDGSRFGGIFDRSATGFLLTGCMGDPPAPAIEVGEAAAPGGP